jgi:hypothetical protein
VSQLRIESVDDIIVLSDGFHMTLTLDGEPDQLLSEVIQGWPLDSQGLRDLQVVRDHLVVTTEHDVDAPARALDWLCGGPDPALDAMERHAENLRAAGKQALALAQHALRTSV